MDDRPLAEMLVSPRTKTAVFIFFYFSAFFSFHEYGSSGQPAEIEGWRSRALFWPD